MSSFKSSRRQDDSYTKIPDEYDGGERTASFYLYCRPLNDPVLCESDDIAFHHWALVAVFVDESIRTMEGNEYNGKLMPYYSKESPKETDNEPKGKYYELVAITTTPQKLHHVTKNNRLNGTTYSVKSNNCHCWVKSLAESISPKLANSLANYKSQREMNFCETAIKSSWASSRASSKSVSRSLVRSARSMAPVDYHRI